MIEAELRERVADRSLCDIPGMNRPALGYIERFLNKHGTDIAGKDR